MCARARFLLPHSFAKGGGEKEGKSFPPPSCAHKHARLLKYVRLFFLCRNVYEIRIAAGSGDTGCCSSVARFDCLSPVWQVFCAFGHPVSVLKDDQGFIHRGISRNQSDAKHSRNVADLSPSLSLVPLKVAPFKLLCFALQHQSLALLPISAVVKTSNEALEAAREMKNLLPKISRSLRAFFLITIN